MFRRLFRFIVWFYFIPFSAFDWRNKSTFPLLDFSGFNSDGNRLVARIFWDLGKHTFFAFSDRFNCWNRLRGFYHSGVSWNSSAFIKQKKRTKGIRLKEVLPKRKERIWPPAEIIRVMLLWVFCSARRRLKTDEHLILLLQPKHKPGKINYLIDCKKVFHRWKTFLQSIYPLTNS